MARVTASAERSNGRVNFARIRSVIDIPNLIEVQQKSYRNFLQYHVRPSQREDVGLESIFRNIFPIHDFNEVASLEYVGYEIGIWECDCGEYRGLGGHEVVCERCAKPVRYKERFDVHESRQRGMTYADPLRVVVRLVVFDKDEETGGRSIRDLKEQKVYLGEIPLMTDKGTFIINGTERVIVSQMHRSPGAFFNHDKGRSHPSGKVLYSARLIPYRGSWMDFEFDVKDVLYVRIDRRRKMQATVLLRALGYTVEEILNAFYPVEEITQLVTKNEFYRPVTELMVGQKAPEDILDRGTGEVIAREGRKLTRGAFKRLVQSGVRTIRVAPEDLNGRIAGCDIVDKRTGEVLVEVNTEITAETVEAIKERRIDKLPLLFIDEYRYDSSLRDTLASDRVTTEDEALVEIYKRLRPGDTPTKETARALFENMFFNAKRYDLSKIGRLKLNAKLGSDYPLEDRLLKREDVVAVVRYLLDLRHGIGNVDDIDHLGNRRVRSVGELLENQLRVGLVKMERAIRERMSIQNLEAAMPHDLINSKPITAAIKEFFGSSQLSQFMDQTNPLSEITHKRRLSALGPGGLTRERAGFEVRDVHPTHYGRICPVETPEGPNIGLIASLSTYARVNEFGFIETPYRKVAGGRVTDQVEFLSAIEEDRYVIAQANAAVDANGRFTQELISARRGGEFILSGPDQVDYMDVSPKQLVSVVASLIPFLENDDANRALMGSNMQRQAVPLLRTEAPIVGTGMEEIAARDSGAVVVAKNDGVVVGVDATRIVVRADGANDDGAGAHVDIYNLTKYQRSNQSTCINQKPIVREGERVCRRQVIADGPATDHGELALGRNVLVAFMPWGGYNFEDAVVISEKVVKEDIFTSIHIQEFEVEARDTKQGKEEITRDIPNVGEEALKDLDECGIIRTGANVKPGDILVGKVTPKGETQLSPEEKLLKAIFGEKGGDVRDSSLVVPPGVEGTVIDVKVFSRRSEEKDARAKAIEQAEIEGLEKDFRDQVRIFKEERDKQIREIMVGLQSLRSVKGEEGDVLIPSRKPMTAGMLERVDGDKLLGLQLIKAGEEKARIAEAVERTEQEIHNLSVRLKDKIAKVVRGDDLPPGVIKMVKVFIAMKRKFSVGDKMAGRHGNKGVVSIIVPEEDMPCLPDGTPVELILNPLGVPSRMNVGQILETHLGWAGNKRDVQYATPVFDGAAEKDTKEQLERAGLNPSGRAVLYDGRTGLPFDQQVVVGYIYMMKLHHLVDDKIHARSTGPYSLVTQQPLGGKAQFGGQRLGEMEVWALEAYGAARSLQEMLTVKSDDLVGRTKMYEAIVKGENTLEANLPESFNVLMLELKSLGLDVELISGDGEKRTPSDGRSGGGKRS